MRGSHPDRAYQSDPHLRFCDRVARKVWKRLPKWLLTTRAFRLLGHRVHARVSAYQSRDQTFWTCFMRNRPLLEVIAAIIRDKRMGSPLTIASIGCSLGAELYSLLYLVRLGCDELCVKATGVDISSEIIDQAKSARFSLDAEELSILGARELADMFVKKNGWLEVRDWIRVGIRWITTDARDPEFVEIVGRHDIVLADNFLGPMSNTEAESCLGNIINITKPSGYLVIDGIDLDLRAQFASRHGLKPVTTRIDEIHQADVTKQDWPWLRWALEPIDRERSDWQYRYSAVFQVRQ